MSSGRVIETRLRVRYAETDAMNIVYHTNYIVWFEVGRGKYFWQQGMSYADCERQGVYFPVSPVLTRGGQCLLPGPGSLRRSRDCADLGAGNAQP